MHLCSPAPGLCPTARPRRWPSPSWRCSVYKTGRWLLCRERLWLTPWCGLGRLPFLRQQGRNPGVTCPCLRSVVRVGWQRAEVSEQMHRLGNRLAHAVPLVWPLLGRRVKRGACMGRYEFPDIAARTESRQATGSNRIGVCQSDASFEFGSRGLDWTFRSRRIQHSILTWYSTTLVLRASFTSLCLGGW